MQNRPPADRRNSTLKKAAWTGIICNLALAFIKGVGGIAGNSKALLADAYHSASDVISSVVVLMGIGAAQKPPDQDHPYGHGKAENVAAIIVSVLLAIAGLEFIIHSLRTFGDDPVVPSAWVLYIILLSIVVKETLYQVKYRIGKRTDSQALFADALHHRSDALSSVAALAGVGASLLASETGIPWLIYGDIISGIVIALMILKMAWDIGSEAIHRTLDHTLHKEETEQMRQRVRQMPGVRSIDQFRAREHGYYIIIDIKISVDPTQTVEKGHAIGKKVKEELLKNSRIEDVMVHINPHSPDR